MKRILQLIFLLMLFAAGAHAQTIGCGATPGGAAQYDQSQCGNVAPFPAAPATPTAISACGTISAAGTYQLTTNLSTTATAICLTFQNGPIVLDFAGHTIQGRIMANGLNSNGTHVYSSAAGGGLTCSDSSASNPGCIFWENGSDPITTVLTPVVTAMEFDHLTLTNTDSSSANSARTLQIGWTPSSNSNSPDLHYPALRVHNITSTSATGINSNRIANIWIDGNGVLDIDYSYNFTTCLATASACQGGVSFWRKSIVVHNNRMVNQLTSGITTDTARGFICDGTLVTQPGDSCQIYNNYVDAEDGRAFRFRNVTVANGPAYIHDNLIDNIRVGTSGFSVGALHICDPDSGSNDGSQYLIWWNTLNINDGNGLFTRGCSGNPVFQNNRINKIGLGTGTLAAIRAPIAGSSTTFTLKNNIPITLTSSPNTSVDAGASLSQCNTGTTGGAGTITTLSCPGPTTLWASFLKPVTDISCAQNITTPQPCGVDWSQNGIPGGIPSGGAGWTVAATVNPLGGGADDAPNINSAISNNCTGTGPPTTGKIIKLITGTYQINTGINLTKSYCVLRGDGANKTILNIGVTSGGVMKIGNGVGPYYQFAFGTNVPVIGGATVGTSTLIVSSANFSKYSVGALISVDQLDTYNTASGANIGYVSAYGSEGFCSWCGNGTGTPNNENSRVQGITVPVTAVANNTPMTGQATITIGDTFPVSLTNYPHAEPMSGSGRAYVGLEDLQFYANNTASGTSATWQMVNCLYCWVTRIEGNYADVSQGEVSWSYGFEIRDNYFSNGYIHHSTSSAPEMSIQLDERATRGLVVNNIFERLHTDMTIERGAAMNVEAYNYGVGDYEEANHSSGSAYTLFAIITHHGAFPMYNLFEGNIGNFIGSDSIWGNTGWETVYRNFMRGTTTICYPVTSIRQPVVCGTAPSVPPTVPVPQGYPPATGHESWWEFQGISAFTPSFNHTGWNAIGNVVGSENIALAVNSSGTPVNVSARVWAVCGGTAGTPCGSGSRSFFATPPAAVGYSFGYGELGDGGGTPNPNCPISVPFGNAAGVCSSQVPWNSLTEIYDYDFVSGVVRGGTVSIPASFFLSSGKPVWWAGSLPYPGIGPDVTGSTATPNGNGHAYNNPAKNCYEAKMGGSTGGSDGSPLIFNANTCYSATGGSISTSPSPLAFGNQAYGVTSASQTITVTNNGTVTETLASGTCPGGGCYWGFTGAFASDFAFVGGGTCSSGLVLAVGANCTVLLSFTPSIVGPETAILNINGLPASNFTNLTGTGLAGTPAASPSSVAFGNQTVGTTSSASSFTLTNNGPGPLTLSSIIASASYAETDNCTIGTPMANGASCTINVTFNPATTGSIPGTVTIASNYISSPTVVTLSGTGVLGSSTLAPTSLAFGNQVISTTSASQTFTLTNAGPGLLTLLSITAAGDFAQTNTCVLGTPMAVAGACNFTVTFTPTQLGNRTGSVTITHNGSNTPAVESLSGTGIPVVTPGNTVIKNGAQIQNGAIIH